MSSRDNLITEAWQRKMKPRARKPKMHLDDITQGTMTDWERKKEIRERCTLCSLQGRPYWLSETHFTSCSGRTPIRGIFGSMFNWLKFLGHASKSEGDTSWLRFPTQNCLWNKRYKLWDIYWQFLILITDPWKKKQFVFLFLLISNQNIMLS